MRLALPPRRPPLLASAVAAVSLALLAPTAPAAPAAAVASQPVACAPAGATNVELGGSRLGQAGAQTALPAGVPAPPPLAATSWLVADVTNGTVVAACNAHLRLRPASTLKVLTALSLVESLDPQARYTATAQDAAIEGSKVGLVPGSTYSVVDLLHGLMLSSGNDAANALAGMVGGMPSAAERMNAEARRLQAADTFAVNTSGLDADGQVSSAYDLALLGREALQRPWLAKVIATTRYDFPAGGTAIGRNRKRFQIANHNRLLGSFAGTTGVKNGYTSLAGGTFVGAATRSGRSYVVTVMNAGQPVTPMALQLLTWAFASAASAAPVGQLVAPLGSASGTTGTPPPSPSPSVSQSALAQPSPTPSPGVSEPGGTPSPQATATAVAAVPVTAQTQTQAPRLAALGYIAVAFTLLLGVSLARSRARTRRARRRST
jgi:D-alanyl-D-alanine carboxypeptidase (penicillin-binding protein 5/6)